MTSDEIKKVPFKQAEISVRRFNDVAIPHHLGLLKNHKSNIEKSLALGDWNKIKKEEINAMRVIKQVKNLLLEMDLLREKVREEDLERFDSMMESGRQKAFEAMKEYMELQLKSPASSLRLPSSATDDDNQSEVVLSNQPIELGTTMAYQQSIPQLQTAFRHEQYQLEQRQACLEELENLQREIIDLNGLFHNVKDMVQVQGESVQVIADNAEEALENVQMGERYLKKALQYKKAMYPVVGALIGTCVGGPIGLVAGLKAGGLAAVGGGILGFTGGSVLKSNPAITQGNLDEVMPSAENCDEVIELNNQNQVPATE